MTSVPRGRYNARVFERTIRDVGRHFEETGLGRVFRAVRRIRVVREESYHNADDNTIGLRPADLRRPYAAFHRRAYLLIHELGHQFAELCLTRADKRALQPLFGDYDAPYRRAPKPRACGPDFVSRYAMVHPVEDFTETFAVCLWRGWDPQAVDRLLGARSPRCRRKAAAVERIIRRERRRAGNATRSSRGPSGTRCP